MTRNNTAQGGFHKLDASAANMTSEAKPFLAAASNHGSPIRQSESKTVSYNTRTVNPPTIKRRATDPLRLPALPLPHLNPTGAKANSLITDTDTAS